MGGLRIRRLVCFLSSSDPFRRAIQYGCRPCDCEEHIADHSGIPHFRRPAGGLWSGAPMFLWRLVSSVDRDVRRTPSGLFWIGLLIVVAFLVIMLNTVPVLAFLVAWLVALILRYPPPSRPVKSEAVLILYLLVGAASGAVMSGSVWLPRELIEFSDRPPIEGYALQTDGDWLPVLAEANRHVEMARLSSIERRTYCSAADHTELWTMRLYELVMQPSRLPVCSALAKESAPSDVRPAAGSGRRTLSAAP